LSASIHGLRRRSGLDCQDKSPRHQRLSFAPSLESATSRGQITLNTSHNISRSSRTIRRRSSPPPPLRAPRRISFWRSVAKRGRKPLRRLLRFRQLPHLRSCRMAPMALDELAQHGFVRIEDDADPRPCPTRRQSSSNPSSMRSGRRMPAVKMPTSSVEVSGCGVSLRWPSRQARDFDHYSRPMILGAALRNNRGAFVVKSLPGDAVGVFAVAGGSNRQHRF